MIDENAAILKAYLASMFKERAEIIEGIFARLDQGLAAGNAQVTFNATAAIVG
jgi:hypothetical protein